ncbi:MAG: hypothetical protein ABW133_24595 [Polyangiaceae bacterium]
MSGADKMSRGGVISSDANALAGGAARRASPLSILLVASLPFALGLFLACSDSPTASPSPFPTGSAAPPIPQRGPAAAGAMPSATVALPKVEFREDDFAETEHSRDPFRSFAKLFSEQGKMRVKSQRQVLLDHYAVDD